MSKKKQTTETSFSRFTKKGDYSRILGIATQSKYSIHVGELDMLVALENIRIEEAKIRKGNLETIENILLTQALSLDAIFNNLANKAVNCEWMNQFDMLLRLALKAQSQCRATLEALANIKRPSQVAFFKQANISNQQVNNVQSVVNTSSPQEIKKQPNQLLEELYGERMDQRATCTPIQTNKKVASLGEINRP